MNALTAFDFNALVNSTVNSNNSNNSMTYPVNNKWVQGSALVMVTCFAIGVLMFGWVIIEALPD